MLTVRSRWRSGARVHRNLIREGTGVNSQDINWRGFSLSCFPQAMRPETHLAARDTDQLRAEVEVIRSLGFNAVRVHQKAEDPRTIQASFEEAVAPQ